MNQCFIISLPRSGSTLLQRLLAAHPRIQTAGEPWIALPLVYALRENGVRAEFSHRSMSQGVSEFVQTLPGGRQTYLREAGRMIERLHEAAAREGRDCFLDKTPRYYLILDELVTMFPQARFIVLHRNPLAVVASILTTWHEGRFRFGSNELDIFEGPRSIARFVSAKRAHVLEVNFEKLVADPSTHLRAITDLLGTEPVPSIELPEDDPLKRAKLGDKTGVHRFSAISTAPVEAWKSSFASPVRKLWSRRYLDWLGDDTLARMGYDREVLREEVAAIPVSFGHIAQDLWDFNGRLLPLYCARRLKFVRQDRRDGRVRYQWRPQ